jgi:hypothetical protein
LKISGQTGFLADKYGLAGVVCNDTAYLMGDYLGLHRFDMENKKWIPTGDSSPIPGNNYFGVFFSLNGKIYYGLAASRYEGPYLNRTLWEFDQNLRSWKQKTSLPEITTKFSCIFFHE